jgi:hypothetical protein
MSSVPERDWKLFRRLQEELTAAACELVFIQVGNLAKQRIGKEHQSYLDLYHLIHAEDAKIGEMFNNPTRNNVLFKIAAVKHFGVLSAEQFQNFTTETQDKVNSILELRYGQ